MNHFPECGTSFLGCAPWCPGNPQFKPAPVQFRCETPAIPLEFSVPDGGSVSVRPSAPSEAEVPHVKDLQRERELEDRRKKYAAKVYDRPEPKRRPITISTAEADAVIPKALRNMIRHARYAKRMQAHRALYDMARELAWHRANARVTWTNDQSKDVLDRVSLLQSTLGSIGSDFQSLRGRLESLDDDLLLLRKQVEEL